MPVFVYHFLGIITKLSDKNIHFSLYFNEMAMNESGDS
jgi:hypothetical protein